MFAWSFGLTVDPATVEFSLHSKQVTNGVYSISNNQSYPVQVEVKLETYEGVPIEKWLDIKTVKIELGPHQTKKVPYRVVAPENLKEECIGRVFFSETTLDKSENGSAIVTRLGSSFYVSPLENTVMSPQIKSISLENMNLKITIKNNGNVHARFYYEVALYDKNGEEIETFEQSPLLVVLPGDEKSGSFVLKSKKNIPDGTYSGVVTFYYGNQFPLEYKLSQLVPVIIKK